MSHFYYYVAFLYLVLNCFSISLPAQSNIDHWETAVFAEDDWRYFVGTSEPTENWYSPLFAPNGWATGPGGIGYGDGDDNTIIDNTISLYMRHQFSVFDLAAVESIVLHADYDDAFVAYLNGIEIARANIGEVGDHPAHDQTANEWREATMYEGGSPEAFNISNELMQATLREGPNILAVQVHNQSFDSSDMSALFFLSLGINNETTLYAPTPEWFTAPISFASSNLPLIAIHTNGQAIQDEPRITAQMGIINNGENIRNFWSDDYNDYDGQISIEIKGSSSQIFPKKNYSIETQDAEGENLNVSLLGMPEENDWVLHGPYSDKSLIRNDLTYHIGRAMGRYAPRTRYCELMINDDYRGIYMLTEKIKRDDNRVDIANVKPEDIEGDELTGGYLVQIDRDNGHPDDGFYSNYPPNQFYSYVEPDFDEMQPIQEEYIRTYLRNFENAMNVNAFTNYQQYIDVPSLVDYVISNELAKEVDSYRLSAYMYKRKDSNGGKLHFGPLWDLNLSYGNYDYCPESPDGWAYQFDVTCGSPLPFWINKLMVVPEVRNTMNCRWFELRSTILHTDTLMQYIDDRATQFDEAQSRNFTRWPVLDQYIWPNSFVGGTYQQEINFLKNWLQQRLLWMDNNMIGTCVVANENMENPPSNLVTVSPNPFERRVVFDLTRPVENGEIVVYDVLGRVVEVLPVGGQTRIVWDALPRLARQGIYTYVLRQEGRILESGKMVKG